MVAGTLLAQDTIHLHGDTIRVGELEWDMQKDWKGRGTRITGNRMLYGDHVRILLRYFPNRMVSEIAFGYLDEEGGFVSHGPARYYYESGELLSKRRFVEGQLQGQAMDFHRNGKPMARAHARDGRLEGAYESYYPDGTREIACYYVRDSLSGTFRTWYSNGQPRRIEHWQGDQKIGPDSTFYENGRLESVIPYDHDLRNGVARVYHRTGRVWTEHRYDQGRLVDITYTQSKEGAPLDPGDFRNGRGWVNVYDANGLLLERVFFRDGHPGKRRKVKGEDGRPSFPEPIARDGG
jgi:antitoxin component YwqK of YwqJK toxin-antitoxin module